MPYKILRAIKVGLNIVHDCLLKLTSLMLIKVIQVSIGIVPGNKHPFIVRVCANTVFIRTEATPPIVAALE